MRRRCSRSAFRSFSTARISRRRRSGPRVAPYGSWKSPITVDLLTAGAIGVGNVDLAEDGLYWLEARPQERGRGVLVVRPHDGEPTDGVPSSFNVRSRVHEYGGGAYWRHRTTIFCSSFEDS